MAAQVGPRVSVIVVNWNTRNLLLDCIRSLEEHNGSVPFEIIVVDNASGDGSADAVRCQHPQVRLIANTENLGFAGGNNLGAREALGEYLLLLNPDTQVPDGAIDGIVSFLETHPEAGIAGPLLIGGDGKPQISSFGLFPSASEAFVHSLQLWRLMPRAQLSRDFLLQPGAGDTWCHTGHLLGACLLVRREVWDSLGGMDEGYFLFLEETDFCLRATLHGWKCAYTTAVRITHIGEQSLGGIPDKSGGLYIRSYRRFCRKHGLGVLERVTVDALLIGGALLLASKAALKHRDLRKAAGVARSIWYGYFKPPNL